MSDEPRFDAIITVYDSAMISGVVYDHTKFIMDIQFNSGKIYRYWNVTPLEFAMLITSRSTGKTFNAVIRDKKYELLSRKDLA